jgi:hypothetical protein
MPVNIGQMYKRWALDPIIEAAKAVSVDFVERFLPYNRVRTADELADLKSRTGNDPYWPDLSQRRAIYGALLGPSDSYQIPRDASPFHEAAAGLREAAIKYSERVFDTGEPMLRQAFIDEIETLQAHLNMLEGAAVNRGDAQTRAIFEAAVEILQDPAVARAFGLPPPDNDEWPLETRNYDGKGAFLIDEITQVLAPQGTGHITRSRFIAMQRVANRGQETIDGVLAYDEDWTEDQVKELIGKAYSWATALKALENAPARYDTGLRKS